VAVLLLGLDAALSARTILSAVTAARNALIDGGNALVTGDPHAAVPYFRSAQTEADLAIAAAGHPGVRAISWLPILRENIDATRAVAVASRDVADAGLTMTDAATSLGWQNILIPATTSIGEVDLGAIRGVAPTFTKVAAQLRDDLGQLDAADSSHLVGPVARGYAEARDNLARDAALAADARNLIHVVPRLWGGDGKSRLLVVVERLGQPGPLGGRPGPVGVLTGSGGRLRLEPLTPAETVVANAATSPDLPTSAPALMAAFAASGQEPVDGVLTLDSVGLADLLWMAGDVEDAGWTQPLAQDNAVEVVEHRTQAGPDAAAADALQAQVVSGVLQGVLDRRPSVEAFGTGMAQLVRDRHMALYAADRHTQMLLTRLGANGAFEPARDPLAVLLTSTGTNRTGTFVQQSVNTSVVLGTDGGARMKTVVDVENRAPKGPPSTLLGRAFAPTPVGSFQADAQVWLPAGADKIGIETSTPTVTSTTEVDGLPVAQAPLSAVSGDGMAMIVTASAPKVAVHEGDGWLYRIRILPQAAVTPSTYRFSVRIPDGARILSASPGLVRGGTILRYRGSPQGPLVLWVRYA
jgi:Protein of unknown function (DUF4012)